MLQTLPRPGTLPCGQIHQALAPSVCANGQLERPHKAPNGVPRGGNNGAPVGQLKHVLFDRFASLATVTLDQVPGGQATHVELLFQYPTWHRPGADGWR